MTTETGVQVYLGPANQLVLGTVTDVGPAAVTLETIDELHQRISFNIPKPTTAEVTEIVSGVIDQQVADSIANDPTIALKAPLDSPSFTGIVTGVSKTMVGLSNVDNTADANKPVSAAVVTALAGKSDTGHGHSKGEVGLGNVDNTADAAKPVSTAVAAALAGKSDTGHTHTKAQIGLGSVDNTADADKPVSAAQAAALALKAPTASPTFTGTVSGVSKSMVGLGNVDNTSDADKPVSTAAAAALAAKAPTESPTFTGTVSGVTKAHVGLSNVDNTADSAKPVSTAVAAALDGKAASVHNHSAADLTTGTLPDARLSARLGAVCSLVTDWNTATSNGFYYSTNTAANISPGGGNAQGYVVATGTAVSQWSWSYQTDTASDSKMFRRDLNAGVWSAWARVRQTEAELDLRYARLSFVTPKDFGAVGNGIADDTVPLQQWLDSPATDKVLGYGDYRHTATLTCSVSDVTIRGNGRLIADTAGIDSLTLSGSSPTVFGITVNGNGKARYGIYSTGAGTVIENCDVFGQYSATNSPRGIYTSTSGGVTVRNNRVSNVNAPGNATQGDSNGLSRGIVLHSLAATTAPSVCSGNVVTDITGEEADAIAILYSDTVVTTYLPGHTMVSGNVIKNSSRRYIKVQGSNVTVADNYIYCDAGFAAVNPSAAIDVIQGSRIWITGNRVEEVGLSSPVSIAGASTERITAVTVTNNYLSEGDGTSPVIYHTYVDNLTITYNTLVGGSSYVNGGTSDGLVVAYNTCIGGVMANTAFAFTGSAIGKVRFNTIPTGRAVGTATGIVFEGNG